VICSGVWGIVLARVRIYVVRVRVSCSESCPNTTISELMTCNIFIRYLA